MVDFVYSELYFTKTVCVGLNVGGRRCTFCSAYELKCSPVVHAISKAGPAGIASSK